MKRTIVILALVLGLITGAAVSADDKQQVTVAQDNRAPKIELTELLDPEDLADDICWVAPEWRDS